jgi:hypothetical protein
MQTKLHYAISESFTARNLPVPPLPHYMQTPRIAIQLNTPQPLWSCGTIAMCTTLHLLLGDRHPRDLCTLYTTTTHMLTLHIALFEWLIESTPPALWQLGCLHHDIQPPSQAHTGSYPPFIISATAALTMGQSWRPPRSTHTVNLAPSDTPIVAAYAPSVPQSGAPPVPTSIGHPSNSRLPTESYISPPRSAPQPLVFSFPKADPSWITSVTDGAHTLRPAPLPTRLMPSSHYRRPTPPHYGDLPRALLRLHVPSVYALPTQEKWRLYVAAQI